MPCDVELNSYVQSITEISKCMEHINSPVQITFKECLAAVTEPNLTQDDCLLFKINVVIDYLHDEFNTGHWSNVPEKTRQAFTACSFIKAIIVLKNNEESIEVLKDALKSIDLGLLLGAPLQENSELLLQSASCLTNKLNQSPIPNITPALSSDLNKYTLKRKRSSSENYLSYENIKGKEIATISCPSMERFNKEYFIPQIPVKLKDCMKHWPAMQKWLDVNYLLSVAGNRTVPVEIGSHYADENWSQKLMTLQDFIKNHFLADSSSDALGYLAQHNLFDQIAELRNDISIPEYCCLSKNYDESCEPDINAWFGPKNTVSPLHFDPKDNILAQVFGTKQIVIFSPQDSEYLYPHEDKLLFNTAQINPLQPDLDKYPLFIKATLHKCILEPGEMLFIPEKWWHHVTALDKSFSKIKGNFENLTHRTLKHHK